MQTEYTIEGSCPGVLRFEYQPTLQCALIGTPEETPAILVLSLLNQGKQSWKQVEAVIDGPMFARSSMTIDALSPLQEMPLSELSLVPDTSEYLHLDDEVSTNFHLTVRVDGSEIFYLTFPILLLQPKQTPVSMSADSPTAQKRKMWERKLLDLTLRNNLLNVRFGTRVMPLLCDDISTLEDRLDMAQTFELRHRPAVPKEGEPADIPGANDLCADLTQTEQVKVTKELYRTARTLMEENGANSLFLSLGLLRWCEEDNKEKSHLAPILLVPVDLLRHSSRQYALRSRDEETLLNVTLFEMLRQDYEIEVAGLDPLPLDEHGIDVHKVMNLVKKAIKGHKGWAVEERATLGVYSFTKFVMWHDIHSHGEELDAHPQVSGILTRELHLGEEQIPAVDARDIDMQCHPTEFALPVDIDSSQFEAVVESGRGRSFILHGPPGTGKSQTITNMIANALFQGKRVLFVAEKKAALEVVQCRLQKIGLSPFCLELHSNKSDKKSLLEQFRKTLEVAHEKTPEEYRVQGERLSAKRKELIAYVETIHKQQSNGLSLHDNICRYLAIAGPAMELREEVAIHRKASELEDIALKLQELDGVADIIGCHPADHPLLGLYPRVNSVDNQDEVGRLLDKLPSVIAAVRKKANGWINRWFMRRSEMDLLADDADWKRLQEVAEMDAACITDLDTITASLNRWNASRDKMRHWYQFSTRYIALRQYDIDAVLGYYLEHRTGKETADAFLKGVYFRNASHLIDHDEMLRGFDSGMFERDIQQYRHLVQEFQSLTRQELFVRLAANVPDTAEVEAATGSSELGILRHRLGNKQHRYTIRRILDDMPTLLPRLSPCMLMSPLSVAQYLPLTDDPTRMFDLIIFDEASQMPTSEAIGAIARGKALVVVGDPKQMPPTAFFQTNTVGEEEIDFDQESILDDCAPLLPSRRLSMHYRSAHESLIAFSNTHYYEGGLITFPSVDDQVSRVSFHAVDGHYDYGKTRCNMAEGQAIVAEVMRRLADPELSKHSIGIVAFSKVQSDLIEDLLADALAANKELEQLALNSTEPLFIKNLENVQGDERDVILFSVGYGPDAEGKVSMNFGPLNQTGGERRLNVAVSRARMEMMVFSTLQPEQIDLRRTNALGVAGLRDFLLYARDGILPGVSTDDAHKDEALETQIADSIRQMGYEVRTNVGRSSLRVDVAVVDPLTPERYLCGILCDGVRYYKTPTVRDREVVQPNVLGRLGWPLLRVWGQSWFENRQKVLDALKTQIDALVDKHKEELE